MIRISITNSILRQIIAIEEKKFFINSAPYSSNGKKALKKEAMKKASYAVNTLFHEGEIGDFDFPDGEYDMRDLTQDQRRVHNYLEAFSYLEECASNQEPFSLKLLLEIQSILCSGISDENSGYRSLSAPGTQFSVSSKKTGLPSYFPPQYYEVNLLLEELVNYLTNTDDHPLIVAATVLYQIVTVYPFYFENELTAILMSRFILMERGYSFQGLSIFESLLANDLEKFHTSLEMGLSYDYHFGRDNPSNPEIWMNYFLDIILEDVEYVASLSSRGGKEELLTSISCLSGKEKEFLRFLLENRMHEFSPIDVSRILEVNNKTIINRCKPLIENGLIIPNLVKERIRSYELSPDVIHHKSEICALK